VVIRVAADRLPRWAPGDGPARWPRHGHDELRRPRRAGAPGPPL